MLLLCPCTSLNQILTENITQNISDMTLNTSGGKNLNMRLHSQIKQMFVIFQFLKCHGGLLFFSMSIIIG